MATIFALVATQLGSNQYMDSVSILSINGVGIDERRMLERVLQNGGGVEWEATVVENTTVVTKKDADGNIVEATINGEETAVDGASNSSALISAATNTDSIGASIVSLVAETISEATDTSNGEEGGNSTVPSFLETFQATIEAATESDPEVQATLSNLIDSIVVQPAITDLEQEIVVAQAFGEVETETVMVEVVLTSAPTTPITPRPTMMPASGPSTPVVVGGTLTYGNVNLSDLSDVEQTIFKEYVCNAVEEQGCPTDGSAVSCNCVVTNMSSSSRRNTFRKLRTLQTSSLVIEYELILELICGTSDCSDAQQVANGVYEKVIGDLKGAIDDGSMISSVQESLLSLSSELADNVATVLQQATVTGDFSPVIIPILALLSEWYPDWSGGSHKCLNDGGAPFYMKFNGGYFEPSLDACCERYFNYDIFTCTGGSGTVPSGFYPNWGGTQTRCFNSTETADTLPDYMRRSPEEWFSDDVESCCERHYNWARSDCTSLSGGSVSEQATNKWYVNHQEEICEQDCAKENGGSCGGLAKPWDTLHDSASACCEAKLPWLVSSTCEAQSNLVNTVGTSHWYVDWEIEKCVKDCDNSSDDNCGGLAKNWDDLYVSSSACCERIWYVDEDECTLDLPGGSLRA